GHQWLHHRSGFVSCLSVVSPDLPRNTTYALSPGQPSPGPPSLLRPPIAITSRAGILTCFPSITPFGLTLWVDSPCPDYRWTGTLGLPARTLFVPFIVTYDRIRTSDISSIPLDTPSQTYRTLPYHSYISMKPRLRCLV